MTVPHYESSRQSGNPATPTLVFLHGLGCDRTFWRAQEAELRGVFDILLIDLPGHGESRLAADSRVSVPVMVDAVRAVLDGDNVARAVFVGHSLGSLVARELYRSDPERFAGFVSVDAPIHPQTSVLPWTLRVLMRTPLFPLLRRRFVARLLTQQTPAGIRAKVESSMMTTPKRVFRKLAEELPGYMHEKVDYRIPVLAIHAGGSIYGDPFHLEASETVALDLRFERIEGASHFVMMERPDEVNALLADFARSVSARPYHGS